MIAKYKENKLDHLQNIYQASASLSTTEDKYDG